MSEASAPSVAPAASYAMELSRALWFRQPATRCRFLFAADDPEGLVVAPLGPKGTRTVVEAAKRLQASGRAAVTGAMLVDGDGDAVFCLAGEPAPFLRSLAGWAAGRAGAVPALGTLLTAGAARLPAQLGADATVEALSLAELEVVRDPAAWDGLLPTDDASVIAILAERMPGERMWFWMCDDVADDMVPLLLQPVAWDPNRDRLDAQIRRLEAEGAGEGVTGYAFVAEDGRVQFVSGRLRPRLMAELVAWVRQQLAAHPAVARLAQCQFVVVRHGKVFEVLEDPLLWKGIEAPPAPGTLAGAAAAVARLAPNGALWAWATATAPGGGFLAVAPVVGDEGGTAFEVQAAGLYRRFPGSFRDASTGMLTREASGRLRIDWHGGDQRAAAGALAAAARLEPGLQALADVAGTEMSR